MLLKSQMLTLPRLVCSPWRVGDVTTKAYIYISARTPPPPLPPPPLPLLSQHQQKSYIHHTAIPTRPRLNRHLTSSRLQSQSPTILPFIQSLLHSFTGMPASDAAQTKVQKIIDENPVVVFSKSYCPHCRAAKRLLTDHNAKFFVLELDEVDDGPDIQGALQYLTRQTTVPNIFINKKHIGGNSDLQSRKAQLKEMLVQAGDV